MSTPRRLPSVGIDVPGHPSADTSGVDLSAWAREVAALLDTLPPRQSATLRLLYFDRLSGSEAAQRLGVAVADVHASAADGLRRLGRAIQTDALV